MLLFGFLCSWKFSEVQFSCFLSLLLLFIFNRVFNFVSARWHIALYAIARLSVCHVGCSFKNGSPIPLVFAW